ncbi:putative leucine-rich repeat-containing protein DDB_G0290503 [Cotesia glomerata]|uniref:putative leucine-rich repeat-containing protein DDB_G0290503 n=1 Tax=Cotesia glomerata TaxID=32391 RepID=UPI001D013F2E|nr:putative leucine-rich repeat-containing protein DDB_G0290503 [Cotesia glomerata]
MAHYGNSSSYRYGGGSCSHHNPLVTNIGRIHTPLRYASLLSTISESPASLYHHLSPGIMSGRHKVNSYSQYQANHVRRDHFAIHLQCQSLKTNAALQNYFEKHEKSAGELLMEKFSIKDKHQVSSKIISHTSKSKLLPRGLRDTIQRRMTRKLMKKRLSSDIQLSYIPKHESAISQVQAQLLDNLVAEEQAKINEENTSLSIAKNTLEENLLTSSEFNQVDDKHSFSLEIDDKLFKDNNFNNNNKKTVTNSILETKIEKNLEDLKNNSRFPPLCILVQSRNNQHTDELSNDHSRNSSYLQIKENLISKTQLHELQSTYTQQQNTINIETVQLKSNVCCSEDIDTCSKDIIERNIEVKSGRGSNNQQGIQAQYDPPFEKFIQAQPKNRQEDSRSLIVSKNLQNLVEDYSGQLEIDKCQKTANKICKFPLQDINQMNLDEIKRISTNSQFLLQPRTSNIKDYGDSEVIVTVIKNNNNNQQPNSIVDSMSVSSIEKMNAEQNEISNSRRISDYHNILEKESTVDANIDDSNKDSKNNHTQHSIKELECHTSMTLTGSERITNVLALEKSSASNPFEKSIHLKKNSLILENSNSFSGQSSAVVSENQSSKCDTVSATGNLISNDKLSKTSRENCFENENLYTSSSLEIQASQKKSELLVDNKKFKSISSSSNIEKIEDKKVCSENSDEHLNSLIKRNVMLTPTSKSGETDINDDFDAKLKVDSIDVDENKKKNELSDFQIEEIMEKNKTLLIERDVEEKPTKNLKIMRSTTKKIKKSTSVKRDQESLAENVTDKKLDEVTVSSLAILEESPLLSQFVNEEIETANYDLNTPISNNQESNDKTSYKDNTFLIEFIEIQGSLNNSNNEIVEYFDIAIDKNSKNFSNSHQTAEQNKTPRSQKKSTHKPSKQNELIQKNIVADKLKEKNVSIPKNRPLDLIKMFYITPASLLTATPRDLSTVRRAKIKKKKHVGCSSSTNHNCTESDESIQSIAEMKQKRRDSSISNERPNEKTSFERSNYSSLDGSPTLPNKRLRLVQAWLRLSAKL